MYLVVRGLVPAFTFTNFLKRRGTRGGLSARQSWKRIPMDKAANESASPWMPSVALDVCKQRLRTTGSSPFQGPLGLGRHSVFRTEMEFPFIGSRVKTMTASFMLSSKGPRLSGVLHSRVM